MDKKYLLIDANVLPEIFLKVLDAKKLIANGEARNTSEAVKTVGISRGAFYKYKDCVFPYNKVSERSILTVQAVLHDNPGVLMSFVTAFYDMGANILTINQNIPSDGYALVSISARTDSMIHSVEDLFGTLKSIRGVKSVLNVSNQ